MNDFMNNSKSFIRNPLGVIGLFISLIYGAMCLVLTNIILELEYGLQVALIAFIIGFPILILFAFIYLVAKHHRKLYAPKDYQDETHFMADYLTVTEKKNKIDNEISDLLQAEVLKENKSIISETDKSTPKGEKQTDKIPSIKEANTPNIEVSNRKDFLLLEEIALRKWERENKMFIQRQVKLHLTDSIDLEVDGFGIKEDMKYVFEVNIIKDINVSESIITKIRRMISIALAEKGYKFVFIVIHEKGQGKLINDQLFKIHNKKSDKFCFVYYSQESLYKEYEI